MTSWLVGLLFALQAPAAGGTTVAVQTQLESNVRIEVSRGLPASWAYTPLRVTIENGSDREREWAFSFTATSTAGRGRRDSRFEIRVPGHGRAVRELIVPLGSDLFEASTLMMRVSGHAVVSPGFDYALSVYGSNNAHVNGVSTSLFPEGESTTAGALIDPSFLPADWRGLSGLRALALSEKDWAAADPAVKTATLDWVARGGHLVVRSDDPSALRRGLGTVTRAFDPFAVLDTFESPPRPDYIAWAMRSVRRTAASVGWLTGFLIGYAIVIGPVNLFVLAPSGRRARLFWTMPVLSVSASLLLALVILVTDGIGGTGRRVSLVFSLPDVNREVLIQEQAVRTGVLLRTSFALDEPVFLFDAQTNPYPITKRLSSRGTSYSGDWFRSRRVQAQRIEAVRPARARIERVAAAASAGPTIQSALEGRVVELYYRDEEGSLWGARDVAPGERVTLQPVTEEQFEAWWRRATAESGPRIGQLLTGLYWERDLFLGLAEDGARHGAIETLGGIDWNAGAVIYAGRLAGGESTRGAKP